MNAIPCIEDYVLMVLVSLGPKNPPDIPNAFVRGPRQNVTNYVHILFNLEILPFGNKIHPL